MFSVLTQGGKGSYGVNDYYVDSDADISTLPKIPECAAGSSCLVRDGSKVYILGNDNEWKEL